VDERPWRRLRVVLICSELLFVAMLAAIWLVFPSVRASGSLLVFFLYGIPSEFLVSVAPHEPAVLYMATFHDPMVVALVAGAGTLVAEIVNYELLQHLRTIDSLSRFSRMRPIRKLSSAFERAPFASLWIAGFVPVIPFLPFRAFVLLSRYPRGRYLAAAVTSRTARFYLVALLGTVIQPSLFAIVVLFVLLVAATTIPGALHYFARARREHIQNR
jgi:membrane protein YqaA with SNARE-associated domain